MLHSAIGVAQGVPRVCWRKLLVGDVFKCSDLHRLKMEGSLGVLFKCSVDRH